MSKPQDDAAYKALRSIAEDAEPPLSPALLLDLYTIQRDHQYNDDRKEAIELMTRRILAEVDKPQGVQA